MDKTELKERRFLPTRRKLIQLYAALLYNANLKGFVKGDIYTGGIKALCVPGLNCYSCPGAVGACPLGALQNALASSGKRAPWYVLGIILLFAITLGRTVCGWLCPFGLIQELLYKIPTPKIRKSRFTRALSKLKYAVLAVFAVILPLYFALLRGLPVPAFCKYICPAGTLEGALALMANPANADKLSMLGLLFTRKIVILFLVCAACVFAFRAFCRFLCPLGALYGLFARLSVIGVHVEQTKCCNCGQCVRHCRMDVRRVGDAECINCGECIDLCPTGAVSLNAAGRKLREKGAGAPRRTRTAAAAIAMAAVLAAVALAAGLHGAKTEAPAPAPEAQSTDAPETGSAEGMTAPDFTVPLYGGGDFTLSETRGQVTVLNFWATWCGPCVAELPYFEQLQSEHPEIAVLALHSELVTDDVDAFIADAGYALDFALDDSGVIEAFGGSTMLPQTVVIDENGVIIYNQVGSVTYELLSSLIEP